MTLDPNHKASTTQSETTQALPSDRPNSQPIAFRDDDEFYCPECIAEILAVSLAELLTDPSMQQDFTPVFLDEPHPAGIDCAECNAVICPPIWADSALYAVKLYNSDDDPTQIIAVVEGEYAAQWAEFHGSLGGGSWEQADGPEFVYDIISWHRGLIDELESEGFKLDQSEYSEPGDRDLAIAEHACVCEQCSGDWHNAEKHMHPSDSE